MCASPTDNNGTLPHLLTVHITKHSLFIFPPPFSPEALMAHSLIHISMVLSPFFAKALQVADLGSTHGCTSTCVHSSGWISVATVGMKLTCAEEGGGRRGAVGLKRGPGGGKVRTVASDKKGLRWRQCDGHGAITDGSGLVNIHTLHVLFQRNTRP